LKVKRVGVRCFVFGLWGDATLLKSRPCSRSRFRLTASTKFVGELYGQTFGRCYGLENVSLRYFNIFGPRQDPSSPYSGVLASFAPRFWKIPRPVVLETVNRPATSLTWKMPCRRTYWLVEAPNVSGKVFNVGVVDAFL